MVNETAEVDYKEKATTYESMYDTEFRKRHALETKNAELESSLALLKEQLEEIALDYQKCGNERAILLEAVKNISDYQPLSFSAKMGSEALEKIKQVEVGE